jgi:hypothetical protein
MSGAAGLITRTLSPVRSRALRLRAALLLVAAEVLLRTRGATPALRTLARPPRAGQARRGIDPASALAAVQRVGHVTRAKCLTQSVALAALLVRDGRETELVLGCRRYGAAQWGAHAWVVAEGEKLEPVVAGAHEELARCSAAHRWVPAQPPALPRERC